MSKLIPLQKIIAGATDYSVVLCKSGSFKDAHSAFQITEAEAELYHRVQRRH